MRSLFAIWCDLGVRSDLRGKRSRLTLRSRTFRMAFVLFWLPQTVYATALCRAMDSANDASVIYLPRVKAVPHALFGGETTWGRFRLGEGPKFAFGQTLYGESRKVDGPLRPSRQGTRPGKAAGTHSRNLAPTGRKRGRLKDQLPATGESSG